LARLGKSCAIKRSYHSARGKIVNEIRGDRPGKARARKNDLRMQNHWALALTASIALLVYSAF
jgi:hypothetical protein